MLFTQDFKLSLSLKLKDVEAVKKNLKAGNLSEDDFTELLEEHFISMIEAFQEEIEEEYSSVDKIKEAKVVLELL